MEMPSRVSSSQYRFGRCEIDAAKRILTRRGRAVEVEPRVFDLLVYLIEHHHRVLSVEELLDAVWGDVEVTPASVSQAVHKARVAIGDTGDAQRMIATVRGKGFRFVAPLLGGGAERAERPRGELVGRAEELARLERALERARRGSGGLLYVAGEPGIGKTRVLQEIVARAGVHGVEAYVGWCHEGEETIAFSPWRQLGRKIVSRHTRAELEHLGRRHLIEISRAERELSQLSGSASPSMPFDDPALSRLFASVATGLARLARERPLLLILEDVHRADVSSLLLLRFLAHSLAEAPILVVASFRDGALTARERRTRLLAEAERAAGGETVTLEPLSPGETLRLAESLVGASIAGPVLDALCALSGGNPFLLGGLLRLPKTRAAVTSGGNGPGALELPAIVRMAAEEQLGRLGARDRRILAMAAVLGMEFELAPLAEAVDIAPDRVECSLDAAAAANVVVPIDGRTHGFRFVHALVREALYEDLDPRARASHHLRAASALEASARAEPALLAYHFCEGATVGGAERGVEVACEAARLAVSRLDFEGASREFARALHCLDFVPGASPRRRCEILFEAARAARKTDPRRGARLLRESARIARRLADASQSLLAAVVAAAAQLDAETLGAPLELPEPASSQPTAECASNASPLPED